MLKIIYAKSLYSSLYSTWYFSFNFIHLGLDEASILNQISECVDLCSEY